MASYFVRILFQYYVLSVCFCDDFDRSNRFAVKVNKSYKGKVKETIQSSEFLCLAEITPETFVIEYKGLGDGYKTLQHLSEVYKNEIIAWERIRVYENTLKPADISTQDPPLPQPNLVCDKYYGMGVEEAWQLGFTGKNVIVAITDVGVNTDLSDLKNQINVSLCKNFVKNNSDVTPEEFPLLEDIASYYTDHGNKVASVVAAEKHNGICSAGIAFNATIAVLKIYEVQMSKNKYHFQLQPAHWTASDIVAEAFVHKLGQIDVFVNAWSTEQMFDPLDLLTAEAVKHGATDGRGGKGTIYVVPAGPAGNGLSNNIYTVTVGSVGQFGTIPQDSFIDASVITSGLFDGNNITSSSLVTSSKKNKCISSFKGLSAATAQIAGIIALGLEANPNLTLRDILHLLVKASDNRELDSKIVFKQNGAGKYVHEIFGFGLLNASKFVELASAGIYTSPMFANTLQESNTDKHEKLININVCFHCLQFQDVPCVTDIEYIVVSLNLETDTNYLKISVISPYNTESILMAESLKQDELKTVVNGSFVSSHFWDESPVGVWRIKVEFRHKTDITELKDAKLVFYGTQQKQYVMSARQHNICDSFKVRQTTEVVDAVLKPAAANAENPAVNVLYIVGSVFLISLIIFMCAITTIICKKTRIWTRLCTNNHGNQNTTEENGISEVRYRNNNTRTDSLEQKAKRRSRRLVSIEEDEVEEIITIDRSANSPFEATIVKTADKESISFVRQLSSYSNTNDESETNRIVKTDESTRLLKNDTNNDSSNKANDSKDDRSFSDQEENEEMTAFIKSQTGSGLPDKNADSKNKHDRFETKMISEESD